MPGWYFRQQPHPISSSMSPRCWKCPRLCGPALPVVAVTPPSPSSTPTQGQSYPRLYCSSNWAAVLVSLSGRQKYGHGCVPAPFSQFLVGVNQGHWARRGCSADSRLNQGFIIKPVCPHLLFNIYAQTAEDGNTSNQ